MLAAAPVVLLASCGGSADGGTANGGTANGDTANESGASVAHGPSIVRLIDAARESTPLDRSEQTAAEGAALHPDRGPHRFEVVRAEDAPTTNGLLRPIQGLERDGLPAATFGTTGKGRRTIAMAISEPRTTIPASSIDAVHAIVFTPGKGSLNARAVLLDAADGVHRASEWATYNRTDAARELTFALASGAADDPSLEVDRVAIQFDGRPGFASVMSIQAVARNDGAELPSLEAPELVTLGTDSRRAAGLIEGHPWHVTLDLSTGSTLCVSVHQPARYRRAAAAPRLRATLRDAKGTSLMSVEHEVTSGDEDAWTEWSFDLATRAVQGASVELAIVDESETTAAALLGDATIVQGQGTSRAPRTVLLITSDTHRADYVAQAAGGSAAANSVLTPSLDALARRGILFEDCQSTTNVTGPSHIAMMTGVHPKDSRIINNWTQLSDGASTLAEAFASAGYRTFAAVSVSHLAPSRSGLGQGFDRFAHPSGSENDGALAASALTQWISEAPAGDVFLWLHVFDAHAPYRNRADGSHERLDPSERSPITDSDLGNTGLPSWIQASGASDVDELKAWYGAEVEALDAELGRLLARPRVEQAWIAFTADHGESLGENGIWFTHKGLYPPTIQVPLILAGPGVAAARSGAPVQQIDVGQTLLRLAGISTPFPGSDLVAVSQAELIDEPRFALSASGFQASVTSGPWLLSLDLLTFDKLPAETRFYEAGRVRLFDRREGPEEDPSLLRTEFELAKRLRARLIEWLDAQPERGTAVASGSEFEMSDTQREDMKALGYSGSTVERGASWWDESNVTETSWLTRFE